MLKELLKSEHLQALQQRLQENDSILIEEMWNSPKALVSSLAQQCTGKHILILTGASQEETRLYHDFPFFTERPIVDFPAWETLPSEKTPPSPDVVGERYQVLQAILSEKEPQIVISNLQACLQKLIIPENFQNLYLSLHVGDVFLFDDLVERLNDMGYHRSSVASDKGEFAIRGGIIDIFPVSSPDPYRIEFWGDDIESIRIYDPIGQKSIKPIEQAEITPAQELELVGQAKTLGTILDYLGSETIVIFDDLLALEDRYASLVNISGFPSTSFCSIEQFLEQVESLQHIFLCHQPIEELTKVKLEGKKGGYYSASNPMHEITFEMFNRTLTAKRWVAPFVSIGQYLLPHVPEGQEIAGNEILASISNLEQTDCSLHFLCESELEESNLHKKILNEKISLPKKTFFHIGYLSSGMVLHDTKTILLPLTEITHHYKIRRQKLRSTYHTSPTEVYQLTPGEMVVHLNNGIGRYLGLEKKEDINGVTNEFFLIEYANNAKLFVPINQAHLVSKYIGAHDEIPKMHTLGSGKWKRAKERTEKAILGYAKDLLDLYAKRSITKGFSYPEDSAEIQAFAMDFPFEETRDQLEAISQVTQDLRLETPMDRLICGDVGYGKTEVAMRAAFKAVVDGGKQVAVLVPTTVLAMQHYENFVERMSNFPINISVLSRFRTQKQKRETLENTEKGTIDILIGTHRIISKDVKFKDLGLVIIDEEQRFGVKAKEHLKKIKTGVDCLTLSATPIPRTLYMSLVGARNMSVINTPPQDRLPITTLIAEKRDHVIKSALLRELSRDGQAFVIHNRVESIYSVATHLQKLLPNARIAVGHGQMHAQEIDQVFHAFKNGDVDILVTTTIVENGIDIPNANTILIDRADHFGLADLYQLRGRVGRWNRRAYAYFLVPNKTALPEISRKRLNALAETSGYGGGMKLAMRDLEIRGAGDILGLEQSGHISAIGFHLYCKMLKRTVKALQGQGPSIIYDTKIDIKADARLPEKYVNATSLRMEIYQRLAEAMSFEEVDAIWEELQDRFGSPPDPVKWLHHLTRIRVFASLHCITHLKYDKFTLTVDKKEGKDTLTKKFAFPMIDDPQELETITIRALKEKFNI